MKFGILMGAFKEYLKSTNTEIKYTNSSSKDKTSDDYSNISIFSHSKEFKKFLSEKYDTDLNLNSMNLTDIMALDFSNGQINNPFANKETNNDTTIEEQLEDEDNTLILDVLNNILEDESVINIADLNGDGVISDEEKNALLEKMSTLDGNDEDLSIDDIFDAMSDKNILNISPAKEKANSSTSSGASGGSSGGGLSSGGSSGTSSSAASTTSEKNIENMTLEQLNSELDTANNSLGEKQTALSDATSGNSEALSSLKENIDNQYDAYRECLSEVDENLATQLDDITGRLDEKEQEIKNNDLAITNQTIVVQNAQSVYTAAKATRTGLEAQLSTLQGQLSSEEDESKKATIQGLIDSLNSTIETAKENENKAEGTLKDEQATLKEYNDKKPTLEEELGEIKTEKSNFEEQYIDTNADLKQLKENWEQAKTDYQTNQNEAISEATKAITEAQEYINKLNTAIATKEIKVQMKEYSTDPKDDYDDTNGQKLANVAKGKTNGDGAHCLAGVWSSVNSAFGLSAALPEGIGAAYQAAAIFRGEVSGYEEYAQHFVEVEVSSDELNNLPAGAIVVWDQTAGHNYGHISVALGNGQESSDVIRNQLDLGGSYTVFYPV